MQMGQKRTSIKEIMYLRQNWGWNLYFKNVDATYKSLISICRKSV